MQNSTTRPKEGSAKTAPSQCTTSAARAKAQVFLYNLLPALAQFTFSLCQIHLSAQWATFNTYVTGYFSWC